MIQINFNPLEEWTVHRVKKNKNAIIVFNGPTGSGKSFACLDFGNKISKRFNTNFTIDNNVDFSFSGLLKKMALPQNNAPGTVFIFEEIGSVDSGGASRQWQAKTNLFFNSFMQTARSRNQILIFNCPLFSALEKASRSLAHCQITMTGIDYVHKKSFGKPFILQTNAVTGKIYFKYLRFKYKGAKTKFQQVSFEMPPPEIIVPYEKQKLAFLDNLNKKILTADEEEKGKEVKTAIKRAEPTDEELIKDKETLSFRKIAKKYGYSLGWATEHIAKARKRTSNSLNSIANVGFGSVQAEPPSL